MSERLNNTAPFKCPKCNKYYKINATSTAACAVLHQQGDCCHYNQIEVPKPNEPNNTKYDISDFREAWHLYHAIKDKVKFDQLTTDEKLEALRIAAIQKRD